MEFFEVPTDELLDELDMFAKRCQNMAFLGQVEALDKDDFDLVLHHIAELIVRINPDVETTVDTLAEKIETIITNREDALDRARLAGDM